MAERYGGQMSERWSALRVALDVGDFFPGQRPAETRGSNHFGRGLRSREYSVQWEGRGDAAGKVHVAIYGEGWSDLPEGEAVELLRLLTVAHRFRASRFDLAYDSDALPLADLITAAETLSLVSRSRQIEVHRTLRGAKRGDTLTVNSRESDRFLRIYDYRGPTRVEIELKRALATAALSDALRRRAFWPVLVEQVTGLVRFPTVPAWGAVMGC